MNKNGYLVLVVVLLVIAVGVFGKYLYFFSQNNMGIEPLKFGGKVDKVRIGVSEAVPVLSSLVRIADHQDYFEKEGLDVELHYKTNGLVAQADVLKNIVDVATTPDFAIVSDSFEHENFRVLASIGTGEIIEIVALRSNELNKPSDLKGKRVGVLLKSTGEYFLGDFLTKNNLSISDVKVVPMSFEKMSEALKLGQVDAVAVNDAFAYSIKSEMGEKAVSWSAHQDQDVVWLLVSNEEFVKKNPSAVKKLLKAMIDAEEFMAANPDESKKIIKDQLQLDSGYLDQALSHHQFEVALDQELLIAMEYQARWRMRNKLTTETTIPNYLDFIYFDALEEVKPSAITIIH